MTARPATLRRPSIAVAPASPRSDEAGALLRAGDAAMRALYPPEECYLLSAEQLDRDDTVFFVARVDGTAAGCAAMVDRGDYAEVKRMFVDPDARGLGLGHLLMDAVERTARDRGLDRIRLETGHLLASAHALYRARGFIERPVFGGYPDLPGSLFMEKPLTGGA